jgi:hypothetical protein
MSLVCHFCRLRDGQHRMDCPQYGNGGIYDWSATATQTSEKLAEILQKSSTFVGNSKQFAEWDSNQTQVREENTPLTDREKLNYLKKMLRDEEEIILRDNRRIESLKFAVICCERFFERL